MKKIFTLFNLIIFSWLIGGVFSAYTGVSPYISGSTVAAAVVTSSFFMQPDIYAWDSVDVSGIARYAHQFQRKLITSLVNKMDIVNDIMLLPGIKSSMKLPKLKIGRGFRPFSATTEFYTGNAVIGDRELKVDVGKKELLIDVEAFRHKYLSAVMSAGSGANKMEIPFARYIWDELIKSMAAEVNDDVAYFGFDKADAVAFDAGATYAAGDYITYTLNGITEYYKCLATTTAGQDPEDTPAKWELVTASAVAIGLKYVLDAAITAGHTPVATGVIDNTSGKEAHAAFLKLFRSFSTAYKNAGVIIHPGYTDWEYLLDDLKTQFQYTVTDMSKDKMNGALPLPLTENKCWVKPASWLGTSRRLIAQPVDMARMKGVNLVMGTDVLSDANEIKTKENLWTLEAGIKFVLGFQISDLDALKVGDQA